MRKHALVLAMGLAATGLASACVAQPAQDQPPPGYNGPPPGYSGPPPGQMNGPPPGGDDMAGPPPGADMGGPPPGGPGGAMSGPPGMGPHNMRARFDMANTTHDGRLTMEQAQAAGWHAVARNFAAIDRDNKGYVTVQDIRAWNQARRAARGGMQGPPPGSMQGPAPQGGPGPQGSQGPPPQY